MNAAAVLFVVVDLLGLVFVARILVRRRRARHEARDHFSQRELVRRGWGRR
jgi:hypothetical protein